MKNIGISAEMYGMKVLFEIHNSGIACIFKLSPERRW
jgi:hypothetical protein